MANYDQTIQRYLLGELPESEQMTLEQRYFKDERLFEQIVQVEKELNDRYVRGLLPSTTRQRFEKYYLAHPNRRQRAFFAEALAAKAELSEEIVDALASPTLRWVDRLMLFLSGPKLAWASLIVVLSIAIIASWFFIETRHLHQQLTTLDSERISQEKRERELQQHVINERLRADSLSKELAELRDEHDAAPSPSKKAAFATLMLAIGGTRVIDTGSPTVFVIPAATEEVRVQLNLQEKNYPSYRVLLQSAAGNTIFTSGKLAATPRKSGATVTLLIPARLLSAGDYMLTLSGISQNGGVEDISKSMVRVARK
jgi:hypothetical protein